MKTYIYILFILFCPVLLGFSHLFAQQNTNALGGNAVGTGGSAAYSIGQIDYSTAVGSAEGLQQPYEIWVISGSDEKDIDLSFYVYPNPVTDLLVLNVQNINIQHMTYLLYDVQGKIIEKQKLIGSKTAISMTNLDNGIYFIKVLSDNKEEKIFKIIKSK